MCYNTGMSKALIARDTGCPDYIFIPRNRIRTIRSDKDSHFTESLAKNASESENLTGLVCNKIVIAGISVLAKQPLHYRLSFFSRDTLTDSDLDQDTFLGGVEIDLSKYSMEEMGIE